jgi:hypothetical protein
MKKNSMDQNMEKLIPLASMSLEDEYALDQP